MNSNPTAPDCTPNEWVVQLERFQRFTSAELEAELERRKLDPTRPDWCWNSFGSLLYYRQTGFAIRQVDNLCGRNEPQPADDFRDLPAFSDGPWQIVAMDDYGYCTFRDEAVFSDFDKIKNELTKNLAFYLAAKEKNDT